MSVTKVTVVKLDPYHKTLGLIVPAAVQKFNEVLHQLGDEEGVVATQFFPRLFAKDPNVLLLVAVAPDGVIKGLCSAAVVNGECVMTQPRLDGPTENDAGAEMIELVEDWASSLGFKKIMLISRRIDPKWSKKHGFEVTRYIQEKEIE